MSQTIRSAKTKLLVFLVSVFIVALTGVIIIAKHYDVSKESFGRSVTDTLLTVISVSVIGTMITLLLNNYNREQEKLVNDYNRRQAKISEEQTREQAKLDKAKEKRQMQEENRNEYRKEVLANLNKLYAKTKNARRMLRAKGFSRPYYKREDDENMLDLTVYDETMDDINESQLELESIRDEITTNRSAFSNTASIIKSLSQMEEYLGEFVSEYEKYRPAFSGNPSTLRIGDLKEIKRLLAHADKGGFITNFSEQFKTIKKEIRNDIIFLPDSGLA